MPEWGMSFKRAADALVAARRRAHERAAGAE